MKIPARVWIPVAAVAALILGFAVIGGLHRPAAEALPAMGVVETFTLDDQTVLAVLSEASELVTIKEDYVVQGHLTSFRELWGLKVPLTTDDTYVAIHGTIGFGIDLSEVDVEVDNRRQIIYLTLPEEQVIFNEVEDADTISEVLHDSWFTETTFEEYSAFIADLKQSKQDALMEDHAFLERVEAQTQDVLTGFLSKADPTAEYVVVYR